ncbi:transposable element Tc3 transposase [Caerostris darwini]|uniref:Transposable element Tc3 transposase n=1 Tax=Caerostris darwini TaxID=1538125 RepID=A0AAV4WIT4_9ARAC|nr:transposable element Tc3 transposase [Caerostris darwini]
MAYTPGYPEFVLYYLSNPQGQGIKGVLAICQLDCVLLGNVMFTEVSQFALQTDDRQERVGSEESTRHRLQNITGHCVFRGGSIMAWTGISLGNCIDLYIFRRGSATAVHYQDDVIDPTV